MAPADAPCLGDLISAFATTPWPPQQIPKKTVHAIIHDNVIPDLVKGRDRLRFLLRFELKGCRRSQRTGTSHVELAPDALPFQRQASRTATVTDQPSTIGESRVIRFRFPTCAMPRWLSGSIRHPCS
jgi:hypothetical protein